MNLLQQFAAFVKNEKLEEFVQVELKTLFSYNIPLLEKFKHLSHAEMVTSSRKSLSDFLTSIEEGKGIDVVKQRMTEWKQNRLPGFDRSDIEFADIILIYAAQKISLISFIPSFSNEATVAVDITLELETYYKQAQEIALGIFSEIQQENKQKLRESEEKYKDIFDNATDLIYIVSTSGEILYANPAWLNALKYEPDELEGKSVLDFVSEERKESYLEHRKRIMKGIDEKEEFATCFVTKDGKELPVEGYINCKFENNIPQYTRGIFRNVTKRKEDEQKLRLYNEQLIEREENLRQLIFHAPDAIVVIDGDNIIQLWNPKAEETFGWKTDEVTGKDLTEIIIPVEYREKHRNGVRRVIETGITKLINTTVEVTAINKEQDRLLISLTLSQSVRRGKTIFIAFVRDITQQKKNEVELENKRKQLEQSNEQLEQYAWLASHDLKEPLRKIVTYSDLLITRHGDEISEEVKSQLKKIYDSTKRMERLIQAILEYSQINETAELFETIDLNEVLDEVMVDLELQIENKSGKIIIGNLPRVEGIKVQMRQLFQNLISNAFKYSNPGVPPVIEVDSNCENQRCTINVKDNGIGFNNAYAEKIFMVFQRLQTSKEEGTGIGLALCKKIVERHRGSIKAESVEGQGSVFQITLPLHQ